jgi:hypothetical protein
MDEVETIDAVLRPEELMDLFIAGMKYYEKGGRHDSSPYCHDPRDKIDQIMVKFLRNVLKSRRHPAPTETVVRDMFGLHVRRPRSTIALRERSTRSRGLK